MRMEEKEEKSYTIASVAFEVENLASPSAVAGPSTAHVVGQDSWMQMAFILVTGTNSAFILSYPKLILASLGWIGGLFGLAIGAAFSLYANCLLAELHYLDGKRHIRFRDLANHIYGRKMYLVTWILQYANLFTINTGFIILAGQALKSIHHTFDHAGGSMKLATWIAVVDGVCLVIGFVVPHLSALRVWLIVSGALTAIYIIISVGGSIRYAQTGPSHSADYSIQGSHVTKVFNAISAVANITFAYNTGIVPELQAILKEPAVNNMKKALYSQFILGLPILYTVVSVAYWAFGSGISSYMLNDIHASQWELTLANTAVFLQTVISVQIFLSPMYELFDTKFGRAEQGPWSIHNSVVRLVARGLYLAVNTLVAAALPFLGDFTNLTGAISFFPLTFVLGSHMYLRSTPQLGRPQKCWHYFNVIFFSMLSILTCAAAFRLIVVDSATYSIFADI